MKRTLLILVLCFFCAGMLKAANEYDYVGNKHTKVFHYITCWHIKQISDKNITYFRTMQEAENEGYRLCDYSKKKLSETKINLPIKE